MTYCTYCRSNCRHQSCALPSGFVISQETFVEPHAAHRESIEPTPSTRTTVHGQVHVYGSQVESLVPPYTHGSVSFSRGACVFAFAALRSSRALSVCVRWMGTCAGRRRRARVRVSRLAHASGRPCPRTHCSTSACSYSTAYAVLVASQGQSCVRAYTSASPGANP